MATNIKLTQSVSGYSIFKTNQLLTAEHLNSIGRFFDYQDRLTRARLLGVGIVCGLNVSFGSRSITISKGVGVTSDGDLLSFDADQAFSGIAPFDDKDAQYDLFRTLVDNRETPALWYLTQDQQEDGFTPVPAFFEREHSPSDYVAVLYNSQFIKDTDNCSGEDCDGKADMYHNSIRVLLMHRNDYDSIIKENKCSDEYYLPEVAIPRVLLNEKDNIFSYGDLLTAYRTGINNGAGLLQEPLKAATEAATVLQECYAASGGQKQFFTSKEVSALAQLNELVKTAVAENRQGIQYVYGLLKDISQAYDDFKDSTYDLCYGCCVAPDAFPKHLALGLLQNATSIYSKYRQEFIEAPILNNKNEDVERALKMFARLAKLVACFSIPARPVIRITPSVAIHEKLERKPIPYYYDVENIVDDWAPTFSRRNRNNAILSYHAALYSSLPHITQPLAYNIDQYSFFRIEGHIGKTYDNAYTTIDNLRKQYDLPFDIAGVQLQKEKIRFIPPKTIKPGLLDILYDKEKLLLGTKLDFIKKYNDTIAVNLPDDNELSQPAITKEYGDPRALKNMVLTKKLELENQITNAKTILAKPVLETAGKVDWDDMHINMANAGAQINKNSKLFTTAAYRSPIENLAILEQPKTLLWLGDLLIKQKQQVEDGYIFSNFLKQNPSMLHNAGVCKGGTFILVYEKTGDVETVVADFYLPYIAKADLVEAAVDTSNLPVRPIREIDFTISKDIVKRPILNADIFSINDQLVKVKDLTQQSERFLGQKINEFDGRINRVGEQVLKNEQSIIQKVDVVKDRYESSFSKLISSYDTVVTKSNVKVNGTQLGEVTRDEFEALVTGVRTEFNGKLGDFETNMNNRFNAVAKDITDNKVLIQKATTDISSLDVKITSTRNEVLAKADQDIKTVNDRVTAVNNTLDAKIGQSIVANEAKLNTAIAGINQTINNNANVFDQKLATTRTEILNTADKTATSKLNAQKENFDSSITKINNDIIKIRPR
ncbi:hypothetical protein ACTJIJ_05735 [Niabella sp. 22666]|uniref:hypothetical protein n=1 Tax=Niabella sp. 22666 TaxID=3453954 RepID=UPI003F85041A